jgi:hypothetical protein
MKQAKNARRRSIFLLAGLIVALGAIQGAAAVPGHKFMVTAGASMFSSSAGAYRQLYGASSLMPDIKFTYLVMDHLSVWCGAGFGSDKGTVAEVEEEVSFKRSLFGLGLGYVRNMGSALRLRGELGLAIIHFSEEALGLVNEGSGIGWRIGANLDYFVGKRIFLVLAAAYSQASADAETGKIGLGGAQLGAGFGFAF